MASFELKCANYAIHKVHKVGILALARAARVDPVVMASWCKPWDRQSGMKGTDIHKEEIRLGTLAFYIKYVERAQDYD